MAADEKAAAVEQWTNDPCGSTGIDDEPGGRAYFEQLLAMRREYAPWMDAVLGYAETGGLRVLDVGSGQGIDLARYASAGAHATGIDLTPRHVELARAHLDTLDLSAEVVQGDAESLPFETDTFDRVSSNGVLHHTPDMPASLREIRRVLKPGAEARIIVYHRGSLHYWLEQVLVRGLARGGLRREGSMAGVLSANVEESSVGARPLVNVYSRREVRRMLTEAGFADVRVRVDHLLPTDAFPIAALARFAPPLVNDRVLRRIGRLAGWYVTGLGRA